MKCTDSEVIRSIHLHRWPVTGKAAQPCGAHQGWNPGLSNHSPDPCHVCGWSAADHSSLVPPQAEPEKDLYERREWECANCHRSGVVLLHQGDSPTQRRERFEMSHEAANRWQRPKCREFTEASQSSLRSLVEKAVALCRHRADDAERCYRDPLPPRLTAAERRELHDAKEAAAGEARAYGWCANELNAALGRSTASQPSPVPQEPEREKRLRTALHELHAMVWGECPALLDEDRGGCARLDIEIQELLSEPSPVPALPQKEQEKDTRPLRAGSLAAAGAPPWGSTAPGNEAQR